MAGKIELIAPLDGVVTIQPEDTASNFTVTIPAGTSDLVSNATLRTELNATGSAPIFACRAWCNFNGTGTVAIRASGNVTGITDNGTGDYTVNFTTAMPDANYSTNAFSVGQALNDGNGRQIPFIHSTGFVTTSSVRLVSTWAGDGVTREDNPMFNVAIFR